MHYKKAPISHSFVTNLVTLHFCLSAANEDKATERHIALTLFCCTQHFYLKSHSRLQPHNLGKMQLFLARGGMMNSGARNTGGTKPQIQIL